MLQILVINKNNIFVPRLYGFTVQGPLSTASVSEVGWRGALVKEREEPRLHRHLSDSLNFATVYATF